MSGAHHHAEEAEHVAHQDKKIALLISVLALVLALSETLGKSAQTAGLVYNIEASDTWAFFQAKTIRMTAVRTAAEAMAIQAAAVTDPAVKAAMQKQIDTWQKTATRYDDEPETNEGRKQLAIRAKAAEHNRDTVLSKYHHYEYASAAIQIGIVLASAAVITNMMILAFISGGLGLVGLTFMGLGYYDPHILHALHLI